MPRTQKPCSHTNLLTTPSSHAHPSGYKPFTPQQLFTAATGSRKKITVQYDKFSNFFPAPLVLPDDELAHDPKCPPQSFKSWLNEPERNEVTQRQKTVYVASAPMVEEGMADVLRDWTVPRKEAMPTLKPGLVPQPASSDVLEYLSAFFYGLPVKELDDQLQWAVWAGTNSRNFGRKPGSATLATAPNVIGLKSMKTNTKTRIRVRHLDGNDDISAYRHQLNLNDILDHAIAILPKDAYCLILLVDHDLYEDDDDDFCCGRAYGGSRICVVSSAQYQPKLDTWHGVDVPEGHIWPGSHCAAFAGTACGADSKPLSSSKRKAAATERKIDLVSNDPHGRIGRSASDAVMIDSSTVEGSVDNVLTTPLTEAVNVHKNGLKKKNLLEAELESLYLRRLSLTASHELLHCFGLDHCTYHACAMQSTASIIEDSRQPPYLCPVCENKLARAVSNVQIQKVQAGSAQKGWWEASSIVHWRKARSQAIVAFCEAKGKDNLGFASLGAWIRRLLESGVE